MKKGQKPAWAKTQQEVEAQEEKEVDDLLNVFENGKVKDYLEDEEVNKMLNDLKERITSMKTEDQENWKRKQIQKYKENREEKEEEKQKKDDIVSRISRKSGTESVASQKTVERIEELEKKKEEK